MLRSSSYATGDKTTDDHTISSQITGAQYRRLDYLSYHL
ncbi:hypothetical protein ALTERO38_90361 [Alteromonas sp. 38]|nr:hypothetical protein ALTERO38_90361 [Alteromonas sp. 38]